MLFENVICLLLRVKSSQFLVCLKTVDDTSNSESERVYVTQQS